MKNLKIRDYKFSRQILVYYTNLKVLFTLIVMNSINLFDTHKDPKVFLTLNLRAKKTFDKKPPFDK